MHQILIIGTNPPCPRCALLKATTEQLINEEGIIADVKHLVYTDSKSYEIAEKYHLKPGTAKDVSLKMNVKIDQNEMKKLNTMPPHVQDKIYEPYNKYGWSKNLDLFLKPFELNAKKQGILMTPVLIIDDTLIHFGSVPPLERLKEWLHEI